MPTQKPKYLHDSDPWMLAEEIPNCDLFFSQIFLSSSINFFQKHIGRAYTKTICKYQGYHLRFYFGEKNSFEVGETIARKIIGDPSFGPTINKNIIKVADRLRTYAETIPQENIEKLSDKRLWEIYKTHMDLHLEYYTWCWIPAGGDMFHDNLTKRLREFLSTRVSPERLSEAFLTLTQPVKKSLIFIEQQELLMIAAKIFSRKTLLTIFRKKSVDEIKKKLPPDTAKLLEKHRQKYGYTKHLWVEGEYTLNEYIHQIKEILMGKESPRHILKKQDGELKKSADKRRKLITKLHLDAKWKTIFDAFGDFMVTKIYRRYAQLLAVHHMTPILKEIAQRNRLTERDVRFMLPTEIEKLLLQKKCDKKEIHARTTKCIYYAEKGYDKIFTGAAVESFKKNLKQHVSDGITEIKGQVACLGQARGRVKIIIRASDMEKMNQGDILVSIATDPDIVPAMKKAAAIVTEQGGVTSHAAIVSRELNIPCVIGTKIATRILKDGDLVEVDANKGMVKIITE